MDDMITVPPVSELLIANTNQSGTTWSISLSKGTQSGVGVTVSGQGAWARLEGDMNFSVRSLETSQSYQQLMKSAGFSAGVSSFWSWLGIGANVSQYQQQIDQCFHEIQTSQDVSGSAHFDFSVTGTYPNVPASASAYVLMLEVSDTSGNQFSVASNGDPAANTGAHDQNGDDLPTRNNNSTIHV